MTDSTADDETGAIERGVDAMVALETAEALNAAIDVDALIREDGTTDPVELDKLAAAIGRPIGRLVAKEIVDDSGMTGFAKRKIGRKATQKVTAETVRVVVENVDTAAIAETLVELDESTPGPSVRDTLESADDADSAGRRS